MCSRCYAAIVVMQSRTEAAGSGIHTVVVDRFSGDTGALAVAAAQVLGVTAYDVRAAFNAPGGGPAVIAAFGDPDQAEAARAGLVGAGLHVRVVEAAPRLPHMEGRSFELTDAALVVTDRQGQRRDVRYGDVDLLVRAKAMTSRETVTTERERKFDLGRAVLSGGLINTKTRKTETRSRSTRTEDLLFVFTRADTPLRMSDAELQYQGLGAAIQPSRMANFQYLVAELARRCPRATLDERLRHRAAQTQLLGHTLSPDTYLPFAIGLVADSLRGH